MKSFVNNPHEVVKDSIEGLLIDDKLAVLDRFPEVRVVVRKDWDKSRVALISGGGSGHEPTHAGFVGEGMLTAAVCGDIFASPTVDAVLSAILAVTGEAGSLVIIKNYTGDRLNFGLAVEQARALGYKVQSVTVGDDIALGHTAKARGVAGTLFVHKIAGHLAAQGRSLDEVATIAQKVIDNTMSIGLALTDVQMFHGAKPVRLSEDQAELGLGIHGEPGAKIVPYAPADRLMALASDRLYEKLRDKNARYALLLNNLGTVTPIEMSLLLNSFSKTALAKNIDFVVGPGHFMTALNMSGFSLSVLKLDETLEKALLTDVGPIAWHKARKFVKPSTVASPQLPDVLPYQASADANVRKIVEIVTKTFISIEDSINALDAKVGDGDAGATFASASNTIQHVMDKLPFANGGELFTSIGRILSREAGGSSGVLLSIMFTAAGNDFIQSKDYSKALLAGLKQMQAYGGAKKGSRTMIDALEPAFEALAHGKSLSEATAEARIGADATARVTKTDFGRSSYVPEEALKGIVDPGAEAMAQVFEALSKQF